MNMTSEDFDIPDSGAIFTFGKSRFAENAPSKFWIKNDTLYDVSCGDEHTAIITGSGRVFVIGSNASGQLGLQNTNAVSRPSCIQALKPQRIVQVACGRAHTIVVSDKFNVFSWGFNGEGQLGTGDYSDQDSPIEILQLSGLPLQLAAGSSHSLLLTNRGEIFAWGSNAEGQLGSNSKEELIPSRICLDHRVVAVACGYYHSLALTENGEVLAWGEAKNGKLGLSEKTAKFFHQPQMVCFREKVTMVAAGSSHSVLLTEKGKIFTCGLGSDGQLGQGTDVMEESSFKPVVGVDDKKFLYVTSGCNHCSAITDDGLIYTWGCGMHGKLCLGENNFTHQFRPMLVKRLRHLMSVKVSCGGCHTMVLGYRRTQNVNTSQNLPAIGEVGFNKSSDDAILGLPVRESVRPTAPGDWLKYGEGEESVPLDIQNDQNLVDHAKVKEVNERSEKSQDQLDDNKTKGVEESDSIMDVDDVDDICFVRASTFAKFFNSFRAKNPRLKHASVALKSEAFKSSQECEKENVPLPEEVLKNATADDISEPHQEDIAVETVVSPTKPIDNALREIGTKTQSRACVLL